MKIMSLKTFPTGIWTRLLLAFSTIAMITIIVGILSMLIFQHSEKLFQSITKQHVEEVIQVTDFAKIGGEIIAVAPRLLSAPNDRVRTVIQRDIQSLLSRINNQIVLLNTASTGLKKELRKLASELRKNLEALQISVTSKLELERELNKKTERLRWLYADLIDEVDPLNQDYKYNFDAELEKLIDAVKERKSKIYPDRLQANRHAKETIETIRSNGVLLISLMIQVSTSNDFDQIKNLTSLSGDAITLLRYDINNLPGDASTLTLKQILDEIFILAQGPHSIFSIRNQILGGGIQSRDILAKNNIFVSKLKNIIDEIINSTQQETLAVMDRSNTTMKKAGWLLASMVCLSLLIAGSVLWFYVRGSIVARLATLGKSMEAIAEGDLTYAVPEAGNDEIGRMAAALRIFRDTALTVEETNAKAIIDNAAVGLVIANPDGIIHFFNPMAVSLFTVDEKDMIGGSLYTIVDKKDRDSFITACDAILRNKKESTKQFTFTGRKSDGMTFPIDISISRVRQRKRSRLMITVHDVTEREQAQQLLKKRVREKTDHLSRINIRLRQEIRERRKVQNELVQAGKLAALGQLSAGIAHEMNQPLSAMRYYLHNAKKLLEKGAIDIHEKNLEKIGELIERMAKMISHLKTFSRWRTNRLKPVDITTALDRALTLLTVKIENNGVDVLKKRATDSVTVYADSIRLEQVFVNVISNAIDAVSNNEHGKKKIIIELTETSDTVVAGIIDNGIGIEPENVQTVFDPFFTTKEVGKGLGLGLSISFNIIKGFGGSIVASQDENGFTRFSISLQKTRT